MAQPPQFVELTGKYEDDWKQLNVAMRHIVACLNGGIEFGRNTTSLIKSIDVQMPITDDIRIATGFTKAPVGVIPLGLWKLDNGLTDTTRPDSFSWHFDRGDVVTSYLTSIGGTAKYRLSLLIVGS